MTDWITTDHADPYDAIRDEAIFTLRYSSDRMLHALSQLSDEQLWWRPHPKMNAAGNIVLHVCGNLKQWIVNGVGQRGSQDDRDRPSEFAVQGGYTEQQLAKRLRDTVGQAITAIESVTNQDILRTRHIQITPITGIGALWHSSSHLEGHAQEMIYLTRLQLGDAYRFKDVY